jgi:hypothetical protein
MNRCPANTNSIVADLAVLACFFIFGFLSGLFFAFLVSRSSWQSFFFLKGDKFLIPRYSYWFALSLIQLLGLSGAYQVCVVRHLVIHPISRGRLLPAALIVGLAAPVLRLLTPLMNSRIGLDWDLVVAPIAFIFLLSCALCISSGKLKLLPIAIGWNVLFTAAGFAFIYVSVRMVGRKDSYEFVQWPILYSMLALSFGNWLIWRQRVEFKSAAEQAPGADSPVGSSSS